MVGVAGKKREPLLQFFMVHRMVRSARTRYGPGQWPPRKGRHAA